MIDIKRLRICAIWLGAAFLVSATVFSATPAFANQLNMQIQGINSGQPIPIISYDMSESSAASGAGRSRATGSVTVTRQFDNSSPALFSVMNARRTLAWVRITEVNQSGHKITITMKNALIRAFNQSGGSVRTETLTFQYREIATDQSASPKASKPPQQSLKMGAPKIQ